MICYMTLRRQRQRECTLGTVTCWFLLQALSSTSECCAWTWTPTTGNCYNSAGQQGCSLCATSQSHHDNSSDFKRSQNQSLFLKSTTPLLSMLMSMSIPTTRTTTVPTMKPANPPSPPRSKCSSFSSTSATIKRRSVVAVVAVAAVAWASLAFSDVAYAATTVTSTPAAWQQQLKPSTQERPQILFPDTATLQSRQAQQLAVVEGLVSLRSFRGSMSSSTGTTLEDAVPKKSQQPQQRRPTANDVVVLTIRTMEQPETIIAAAKIPLAKIGVGAFPFRFQMSEKNAVPSSRFHNNSGDSSRSPQEMWREATTRSNLLVKAFVCDRDIVVSSEEQPIEKLQQACYNASNQNPIAGSGASMLLRLPPRSEDTLIANSSNTVRTLIRAPVSIVLD